MKASTLGRLHYFVVAVNELHFGRTAARIGIAQPALSQRVRRLEAELGFALFERTSRRVVLTEPRRALVESARRGLAELERGIEAAQLVSAGEARRLTVLYVAQAMLIFLPRVVRRFRARYPKVRLTLREMSTALQFAALTQGDGDVALVTEPAESAACECRTLWSEPFALIVPSGHAIGSSRRLTPSRLSTLAGESLLLFPRAQTPHLFDRIQSLAREWGVKPEPAQEAVSWHLLLLLVSAGMGITIAPASVRRLRVPGTTARHDSRTPCESATACCDRAQERGQRDVTHAETA